jgi:hypothetical protein
MAHVTRSFSITWDYRCPYGRIAHHHVVNGLRAGGDWNVTFLPFCLGQAHIEPGQPDIWETPERDTGLLALQVGVAVRDTFPDAFLDVHHRLYEGRHLEGLNLRDRSALVEVLRASGVDADAVFDEVDTGRPLAAIEKEHSLYAASHSVWGVPTFIVDDKAVFVRLLSPAGDGADAVRTVDRVLDQIEWPNLNEFKHTSVPY